MGRLLRAVGDDLFARPLFVAVRAVGEGLPNPAADALAAAAAELLARPIELLAPAFVTDPGPGSTAAALLNAVGERSMELGNAPSDFLDLGRLRAALIPLRERVERHLLAMLQAPAPADPPCPGLDELYLGMPGLLSPFYRHPTYLRAKYLALLGVFGRPTAEVWAAVRAGLRVPHIYSLRTAIDAAAALGAAGRVPPEVADDLRERYRQPPEFTRGMVQSYSWLPDESKAGADPAGVRGAVLQGFLAFASPPADLAEWLREAAAEGDVYLNDKIAERLGRQARHNPAALARLVADLDDPRESVRTTAADALGRAGPLPREVVERLVVALRDDPDTWGRANAARALAVQHRATPVELEALLAACDDREEDVRANAARAFTLLAGRGGGPTDALRGLIRHPDPQVRGQTLIHLRAETLPPDPAVATEVCAALAATPVGFTQESAAVVGHFPVVSDDAIRHLCAAYRNREYYSTREGAVTALGRLPRVTLDAVGVLREAQWDDTWWVRIAAADALLRLNRDNPQQVRDVLGPAADAGRNWASTLLALLGHRPDIDWEAALTAGGDEAARLRDAETLLALGRPHPAAVRVAREELDRRDPADPFRWRWAELLRRQAADRRDLLAVLRGYADDSDTEVRRIVREAHADQTVSAARPVPPAESTPALREAHGRLVDLLAHLSCEGSNDSPDVPPVGTAGIPV